MSPFARTQDPTLALIQRKVISSLKAICPSRRSAQPGAAQRQTPAGVGPAPYADSQDLRTRPAFAVRCSSLRCFCAGVPPRVLLGCRLTTASLPAVVFGRRWPCNITGHLDVSTAPTRHSALPGNQLLSAAPDPQPHCSLARTVCLRACCVFLVKVLPLAHCSPAHTACFQAR